MDRMMNSMFSDPFMTGGFVQPGFARDLQPDHPRVNSGRAPGPVIEEVDEEEEDLGDYRSEPIVEEPADEHYHRVHHRQQQRQPDVHTMDQRQRGGNGSNTGIHMDMGLNGFPSITTFGNGAATSSFSYSSSYSSSFGPGQVYSSMTTTRIGPGGVRETQSTVRDGQNGKEEILISRGLGDRERTITRRRHASGQEERVDTLQNIASEEAVNFEQEWMQQAQTNLPNWGGGFGTLLPEGRQRGVQPQLEYRRPRGRYA